MHSPSVSNEVDSLRDGSENQVKWTPLIKFGRNNL